MTCRFIDSSRWRRIEAGEERKTKIKIKIGASKVGRGRDRDDLWKGVGEGLGWVLSVSAVMIYMYFAVNSKKVSRQADRQTADGTLESRPVLIPSASYHHTGVRHPSQRTKLNRPRIHVLEVWLGHNIVVAGLRGRPKKERKKREEKEKARLAALRRIS